MQAVRVLFVDDEPSIVQTMPLILRQHGYEVTAVSTVNEALSQITSAQFEVLISDLNIGEPGDGFVVVSAMRRIQPTCVTIIMTGFPGFETALEAIRSQVDDYLIKPTPIPTLIELIEQKLKNPAPGKVAATKRISQVLRENTSEITQRALNKMKCDRLLGALPLADEQRIDYTPRLLEELATTLESAESNQTAMACLQGAIVRGVKQYQRGYSIPLVATHVHLVERAMYEVIHEHLLSLNLSYFMFDLMRLNDSLGLQLEHTLTAYLNAEQQSLANSGNSPLIES